ncbi:MAG TPA: hypothetical protein VIJ99_12000 [Acidimicrobiales bacterium]
MSRGPTTLRVVGRFGFVGLCAALVLSACGSSTPATVAQRVGGVPSISLSVPLSAVACTATNTCIAVGTSVTSVGPTSVGEVRAPTGGWTSIATPSAVQSTNITTSSCWSTGCLFGGQSPSGDVFWLYDATAQTVTAVTVPPNSLGVNGISCYATLSCAVVDDVKSVAPRFLTTTDGGVTWTTHSPLVMPASEQVSAFTCATALSCMTVGSFQNGVTVYVTSDGGSTWSVRTTLNTSTWSQLTSLSCQHAACVGLADLESGWHVVRTKNFGKSWKRGGVVKSLSYLACASVESCVAAGQNDQTSDTPWIATVDSSTVTPLRLTYVPSGIISVSCGKKICAAIGNTTVMALRP